MKKFSFSLLFILIFGAILRLDHFKLASFWGDEAISANILQNKDISTLWILTFRSGNNPGFVFLMKLWSMFFGDSEASLRSLSIIFSLISILAIYKLGKTLFNKSVAKWSAFLLATSTISIFFAHQARPYSLIIFLSIISSQYLFNLIRKGWNKKDGIIYGLAMLYSLYTHPWFFFLLATHFIITLIYKKDLIKKILITDLILGLLAIPLFAELFLLIETGSNAWIAKVSFKTLKETLFYFTEGMVAILVSIIIIATIAIIRQRKNKKIEINKNSLAVFLLFAVPIILGFVISQFSPMYSSGRHEIVALTGFILCLAYLASRIKNKIIVLILIIFISSAAISTTKIEKQNIKNYTTDQKRAAVFLTESINNNDIVILNNLNKPTFIYYLPRLTNKKYTQITFPYLDKYKLKHPMAIARINFIKIFDKSARNKMLNGLVEKSYEEQKIEAGKESYAEILKTIDNNKDAKIWVVYDSNNKEDLTLINRLNTELQFVKKHEFIKTKEMDKINLQFPMFFDYISEYERRD